MRLDSKLRRSEIRALEYDGLYSSKSLPIRCIICLVSLIFEPDQYFTGFAGPLGCPGDKAHSPFLSHANASSSQRLFGFGYESVDGDGNQCCRPLSASISVLFSSSQQISCLFPNWRSNVPLCVTNMVQIVEILCREQDTT